MRFKFFRTDVLYFSEEGTDTNLNRKSATELDEPDAVTASVCGTEWFVFLMLYRLMNDLLKLLENLFSSNEHGGSDFENLGGRFLVCCVFRSSVLQLSPKS